MIVSFFILPPSTFTGNIIKGCLILIFALIFLSNRFIRYKLHPIAISFRENGIYLKRPSGKIKRRKWKSVIGLKLGKYACIFMILYPFRAPILLYSEAKAETLYYFKKYGVKSNPQLEKVVDWGLKWSNTQNYKNKNK